MKLISVVAGIKGGLNDHSPAVRYINPTQITQIIAGTEVALRVQLADGGRADIFDHKEASRFMDALEQWTP